MEAQTKRRLITEYESDVSPDEIMPLTPTVTVPAGYVAVPLEEYAQLCDTLQRVLILLERFSAGEKLTKEMTLRALGFFDAAIVEEMTKRFGR